MKVWLCPIKPRSWLKVKSKKTFGVSARLRKKLEIKRGDILVFHILHSRNSGIVAVARVASEVFESYQDIWGKGLYPLRVRIAFLHVLRPRGYVIPLSSLFERKRNSSGTFEPYLRNISIIPLTRRQYGVLKRLLKTNEAVT